MPDEDKVMMEHIAIREVLLAKARRVNVPTVMVTPQFSMSMEEWRSFLHVLVRTTKLSESKVSVAYRCSERCCCWRKTQ